jgi:hypothetical protein
MSNKGKDTAPKGSKMRTLRCLEKCRLWSSCCKNCEKRHVGFGVRVSVRASNLGKMYVRAICLCGLAVRLILTYRGDTKKGGMSILTLYDVGEL